MSKYPIDFYAAVRAFEVELIEEALASFDTNREAAEALGLTRTTLVEKRRRLGFPMRTSFEKKEKFDDNMKVNEKPYVYEPQE